MRLLLVIALALPCASATAGAPELGTPPTGDAVPRVEFAFEERVTIGAAEALGDTMLGHRQFIPITGGSVAGPKLHGVVLPGGHDFQLTYAANHCTQLSADYFLKADDGTVIHVFNEGLACPAGERPIFHPRLEAPKGAYEWLTTAAFVATLELEQSSPPAPGKPPAVDAVRIRFFRVR